jgi:hypothetical protein
LRGDLAQTDAQGEFEITSDFPHLTYFAHAVAPGYAEGFSAATKVGGEAVTVELSRGGALEGDVVLPEARDPQGIEVRAFRKQARMGNIESELGCVFRARVDGAGHWRIDALAAGAWLVALDVPRGVASELGWDDERVKRCREVPWVFDVAADATTRASIDLRDEALLRLRGSLPTSLRGSSHHRAYAQLFLEPPLALQIGFTGIGDDGGFELVARTPGRYRLVIHAKPGGRSGSGVITDLVDVTSENGEWKRELPPEALQGQSVRLDPP